MAKAPNKAVAKEEVANVVASIAPSMAPVRLLGYVPLDNDTIELLNDNRVWEEQIFRRIDMLYAAANVNQSTVAVARAHFEIAFAMLNKGIVNAPRIALAHDQDNALLPA